MAPPTTPITYKPIQPAPAKRERPGGSSGSSMTSSTVSGGERQQTKRLKAVTQACHTCRRFKARCDGARPRCGGCAAKDKPCAYEGEEGMSRQAAKQARLEALEKLMVALQSKSSEEAGELFQRIRVGDDPAALLSNSRADSGSVRNPSDVAASSAGSLYRSASSSVPSSSAPFTSAGSTTGSDDSRALTSSSSTLVSSSRRGAARDPLYKYLQDLPNSKIILEGIHSFFCSAGRLFHVFSAAQAEEHHKTVFGLDGHPNFDEKESICVISIVAAIGVQYNPTEFDRGVDEVLYTISRCLFALVLESNPLTIIKVCTLLAMYNINDKGTVALAYIETGLTMCKRQSENTGICHPDQFTKQEWVEFRKTWRTLIFFSSWLASTLGYISETDNSAFEKLVPLAEVEVDIYTVEIGEIVQTELTKISLLKAGILRNRLAFKEITTGGMDSIIKELEEWHGKLPPQMQLQRLGDFNIPPHVRWSIYHVHLLYLGAFMLVYRRIASHCIRSYKAGDKGLVEARNPTVITLVKQGVEAARNSARILGLLYADKGIFRRCWLVIFQCHTSCVVILHSVAQKMLHKHPESEWRDDLSNAQICLDVLRYCGTIDPVALRFLIKLSSIYESLKEFGNKSRSNRQRIEDWVPPPPDLNESQDSSEKEAGTAVESTKNESPVEKYEYLLTIPQDANQDLAKLSVSLLYALCRPWGEADDQKAISKSELDKPFKAAMLSGKPGPDNLESFKERLDWGHSGASASFCWDTTSMGFHANAVTNRTTAKVLPPKMTPEALFLGSEAPNGWSPAYDVEIEGDDN